MLTLTFRLSPRPNPGAIGELAPKETLLRSIELPFCRAPRAPYPASAEMPQRARAIRNAQEHLAPSARQSSLILYSPVRRRATPQSAVHLSVRSARHCSKETSGTLSQSGAVVG